LLDMMGDKTAARAAQKIGVPTLPGTEGRLRIAPGP
jgi:pyruvate carboxylase